MLPLQILQPLLLLVLRHELLPKMSYVIDVTPVIRKLLHMEINTMIYATLATSEAEHEIVRTRMVKLSDIIILSYMPQIYW